MDSVLAVEVPAWYRAGSEMIGGYIDLVLVKDGKIYICDYKPGLDYNLDPSKMHDSFLNAIPQVAGYAIAFKDMFGLDVECVIFNEDGAWSFDPEDTIDIVNDFYYKNNKNTFPEWGFLV